MKNQNKYPFLLALINITHVIIEIFFRQLPVPDYNKLPA